MNDDHKQLLENLQKESDRLKKKMRKLSYRIPNFFKKLWYNLTTKKPHPPYHECKDIDYIEIQFENCEIAKIPRESLCNFWLADIKKNISLCANAVIEDDEASKIWIVIDKEYADTHYSSFAEYFVDQTPTLTERLTNHQDITHIYIVYNDETEVHYSGIWIGDEYNNSAQKVTIENDCVCISIDADNAKKKGKR